MTFILDGKVRQKISNKNYKDYDINYAVSQKNIPNIIDCNLKKDLAILISFGTNIPDTTGHQMTF